MGTKFQQKDLEIIAFLTSGAWDAYELQIERFDSYKADQLFVIKFHVTNLVNPTLNINSLWAININVSDWELIGGKSYMLVYNGTSFDVITGGSGSSLVTSVNGQTGDVVLDLWLVWTKTVNETDIWDNKILVYKVATDEYVLEDKIWDIDWGSSLDEATISIDWGQSI